MTAPTADQIVALMNLGSEISRSDESFFRQTVRMLRDPAPVMLQYMDMRVRMFSLMEAIVSRPEPVRRGSLETNIQIVLPADWSDPVHIHPTEEQIAFACIPISDATDLVNCVICQEANTSREGGASIELRGCHHQFHTTCIREWFSVNVRCPVCRNDIRERDDE